MYSYAPYTFHRQHNPRFQVSVIALSLIKLAEFLTLRAHGADRLAVIIIFPWLYFFLAAVCLEAHELYLARRPEALDGHVDILAGQLPSIAHPGGTRKIIIGAHPNPKTSAWWRMIWGVGALVCTSSLILTYMTMRQQTNLVVILWTGFQVSWMSARMCVYHFAEPTDAVESRMIVKQPWDVLSMSTKTRVVGLMVACARYQTLMHPRGPLQYNGDSFALANLSSILIDTPLRRHYPLPDGQPGNRVSVTILAVIGDTILSSAVWVSGWSGPGPKDLYDCCIISLLVDSPSDSSSPASAIAIPAVRFFSDTETTKAVYDVENVPIPQFVPKGAGNSGSGAWWYYVPCENGLWLSIKINSPNIITGKQKAEIVNNAQITASLSGGKLNISLMHVDEVQRTAELSEMASWAVIKLLAG